MKPKTPKLIKFAGELLGRIKQARIPNLLSKFSKKIYGNHRLLILSILRQRLRRTYRELIEFLEVSKEMRDFIGLKRVPHFTTLQKFTKRAEPSWLELLLERKISEIIAVDSTGFEPGRASHYYLRRISGFSSRNYIKLSARPEGTRLSHPQHPGPRQQGFPAADQRPEVLHSRRRLCL